MARIKFDSGLICMVFLYLGKFTFNFRRLNNCSRDRRIGYMRHCMNTHDDDDGGDLMMIIIKR